MIEAPRQVNRIDSETEARIHAENFLKTNFPGVTFEDILRQDRSRVVKVPRHELIVDLSSTLGMRVMELTDFVQRDHSTIHHAINKPAEKRERDLAEWRLIEFKRHQRLEQKLQLQKKSEEEKRAREKAESEREQTQRRNQIYTQTTVERVAMHYGVKVEEITAPSVKKRFTQPRKTAQYIIFNGTNYSLRKISEIVGRTDHTTAINAVRTVERRLQHDVEFKERVEELQAEINLLTERTLKAPQIEA
jgi:chromosomal replication initiation ATPase DnaA